MAAESTVINYGPACTRSTKGLFLVCILLGLFSFSSSQLNKDRLKMLRKALEKDKEAFQKMKAYQEKRNALSSQSQDYFKLTDFMAEEIKKHKEELPDDYPSVDRFVKNVKDIFEEEKAHEEEKDREFDEKLEKMKNNIRKTEMLIKKLEEQQAEL